MAGQVDTRRDVVSVHSMTIDSHTADTKVRYFHRAEVTVND